MNLISGSFHDGVMLYSHALNETLDRSGARHPGDVINKRMWNRTYHGQFCLKSPIVSHYYAKWQKVCSLFWAGRDHFDQCVMSPTTISFTLYEHFCFVLISLLWFLCCFAFLVFFFFCVFVFFIFAMFFFAVIFFAFCFTFALLCFVFPFALFVFSFRFVFCLGLCFVLFNI